MSEENKNEPRHDKTNKMTVRLAGLQKTDFLPVQTHC